MGPGRGVGLPTGSNRLTPLAVLVPTNSRLGSLTSSTHCLIRGWRSTALQSEGFRSTPSPAHRRRGSSGPDLSERACFLGGDAVSGLFEANKGRSRQRPLRMSTVLSEGRDRNLVARKLACDHHRMRGSTSTTNAMLWGAAQWADVRHLFTQDLQEGFELAGVRCLNPFEAANNRLIDEILPPERDGK
jgi:hypothetical protein